MGYHSLEGASAPASVSKTKIQLEEEAHTAIETSPSTSSSSTTSKTSMNGSASEFDYGYGYESATAHPFRSAFGALVILGVPISLFLYCGGYRWMRRMMRGKGKYRRVGDDLEK